MFPKGPRRDEGLLRELVQSIITDEPRYLRTEVVISEHRWKDNCRRRDYSSTKLIGKTEKRKLMAVLKKLRSL